VLFDNIFQQMISLDSSTNQWGKLTSLNPNFSNISLSKNASSLVFTSTYQQSSDENSPYKCEISSDSQDFFIRYIGNGLADIQIEGQMIKEGGAFKISSGDKVKVAINKEEAKATVEYIFSSELMQSTKGTLKRDRDGKEEIVMSEIEKKMKESFETEVRCLVCWKIAYECVSVVPCLHNFCMNCLMGQLKESQECPECEERFVEFRRNTLLNNLMEGYI